MTKKLLDLSGRIDGLIPLFEDIIRIADPLGIPFFVIGATARDLILETGYGIRSVRATRDLDLAIRVEDWEVYSMLSDALLETGLYKDTSPHRFIYEKEQYIDIIPFGPIESADGEILWPPQNETSMSVIGFGEAYENTLIARLRDEPVLDIRVASLPGLVVLKLISWNDRISGKDRDASDLAHIIKTYYRAGNEDRLFKENHNIMEEIDYRIQEAGARLLGNDIAAMVEKKTKNLIVDILEEEIEQHNLIHSAVKRSLSYDDDYEEYKTLLLEVKKGIYETP